MEMEYRDLLIKLDTKVEYIKEGVDHLKRSDAKQWEKIDDHGQQLSAHHESITTLKKFFYILAGTIVTSIIGGGLAIIFR